MPVIIYFTVALRVSEFFATSKNEQIGGSPATAHEELPADSGAPSIPFSSFVVADPRVDDVFLRKFLRPICLRALEMPGLQMRFFGRVLEADKIRFRQ